MKYIYLLLGIAFLVLLNLNYVQAINVKFVFNSPIAELFKADAVTLYPFVHFYFSENDTMKFIIKHELIHIAQMEDMGVLKWYADYSRQVILVGYENVTYEIEARHNCTYPFTERDYEILHFNGITKYDT